MPEQSPIEITAFAALTLGIVVYFVGAHLTRRFKILAAYSIPEPVSGGLAAATLALVIVLVTGREIEYDLAARDVLLVYFFTTVGLNARIDDLVKGGPLLAVMLALTITFMLVQAMIGVIGAVVFGLPPAAGVMLGTAALIGGHGTAIAWGPAIAADYGVPSAAELGIAAATIGLIMASLLGGPIARHLIHRHDLKPEPSADDAIDTAAVPDPHTAGAVTHVAIMRSIFWIHVAVAIGYSLSESLDAAGIRMPLFVPCLLTAIVLSNTVPRLVPRMPWPAGTQALSVISEFSLSVFLSMSLMSMELWTLANSAGVLAFTMALQALAATTFILFAIFPAVGRNYFAAVISAGFTGVTLGATPTAIANMTAVTQRYGPSKLAFIVLPLVSAFFVDIVNAVIIQRFLSWFG